MFNVRTGYKESFEDVGTDPLYGRFGWAGTALQHLWSSEGGYLIW